MVNTCGQLDSTAAEAGRDHPRMGDDTPVRIGKAAGVVGNPFDPELT